MTRENAPRFGVAGNPPNFWKSKYKSDRLNAVEWLQGIGLNALELQATYGIKMPRERALQFREKAEKCGISLSLHAPYFVNLASKDAGVVNRSIHRVLDAFQLARWLGTDRIVFHPGGFAGDRNRAVEQLISGVKIIQNQLPDDGIFLRAEVGGKINQLGSLDEIITICKETSIVKPCIDFAHLHAREHGSLISTEDFRRVFRRIEGDLGSEVLEFLHCHVYPVDFNNSGEKSHKKFTDRRHTEPQLTFFSKSNPPIQDRYYPRFEPFLDAVIEFNMQPTIICEAKDSQDEGALLMKAYYTKKTSQMAQSLS
ncbi:MAG: TIM barrel protein [Candidatus Jorgensenbacteria bacterium]